MKRWNSGCSGLVVCVNVEKEGGQYATLWEAVLLGFPFAPLVIQLDMETPVVEEVFDDLTQVQVTSNVQ